MGEQRGALPRFASDERWMRQALDLARRAMDEGEVPIGCVVVQSQLGAVGQSGAVGQFGGAGQFDTKGQVGREESEVGSGLPSTTPGSAAEPVFDREIGFERVIGKGWNQTERLEDPTAHAEMIAISAAASTLGYARLEGTRVFVTVEPCLMCAGALLLARVDAVIYGAREPKFGALESRFRVLEAEGLNHYFSASGGLLEEEAAAMLKGFFRSKRRGA